MKKRQILIGVVALCVCLAVGFCIFKAGEGDLMAAEYAIAQAQYPETIAYPAKPDGDEESEWEKYTELVDAYYKQNHERENRSKPYVDGLYPFYQKTIQEFLVCERKENRVYSPLNLYMALSMLAETTNGNSRAQILQLIGASGIEEVRQSAAGLWEANYAADGALECKLANSIWLKQGMKYTEETLRRLADTYHTSSFQGDMGQKKYTIALQKWLNEQTGGLLKEQAGEITLTPETILALASTIYYRARWTDHFDEKSTKEGIFHAAAGDISCDFMHQNRAQTYFFGKNFAAVQLGFNFSGGMWLILPDEGSSVNALVQSGEVLRLIKEGHQWKDQIFIKVNLSMPKFDIMSDLDLKESLKTMGVTDIFDEKTADFSPIIAPEELPYLSKASHAARVLVDEEGCQAAAFTVMAVSGAAMPPEEQVDFVLDRPFIFAITGADNSILFLGVVEEPIK